MTDITSIWQYELKVGDSRHPSEGACAMSAYHWLAHGIIGDKHREDCPIIREYVITLNDQMPNGLRQRLLKPRILFLGDNRDPASEPARLHHIILETTRHIVPLAIEKNFPDPAAALRALPDDASYREIEAAAAAAGAAAAGKAAGAAAWTAAAGAAAAGKAAGAAAAAEAARAAAWPAAWAAAWDDAIAILDGALRIGRRSPDLAEAEIIARVGEFERARLERVW